MDVVRIAAANVGALLPVPLGDGWGYINLNGEVVLQGALSYAGPFEDGIAVLGAGDNKYLAIDRQGRTVLSAKDSIFSLGRGRFVINSKPARFVDLAGQFEVSGQFDMAFPPFQEGLMPVQAGGRFGYLDDSGKLAIGLQFDWAQGFSEGLAVAREKGKWGFIDHSGKWVIRPQFALAFEFSEGLACVGIGEDQYQFINHEGKPAFERRTIEFTWFREGLACIRESKTSRYGYIDQSGRYVIAPVFDSAAPFQEGLAWARRGRKVGYIDQSGTFVIELAEPDATMASFRNGLACFASERSWKWIDRTGRVIWDSGSVRRAQQ